MLFINSSIIYLFTNLILNKLFGSSEIIKIEKNNTKKKIVYKCVREYKVQFIKLVGSVQVGLCSFF